MDPITIALAIIGVGAGYGVSQVATKKKIGSAAHEAEKQLAKANKEYSSLLKLFCNKKIILRNLFNN